MANPEPTPGCLFFASKSCKKSTDLVDFLNFLAKFNEHLMKHKRLLNGVFTAQCIDSFLRQHARYRRGELGKRLICSQREIKPASHIKRCNDFLKRLERGDVFREVNEAAQYFDVPVEFLLFGNHSSLPPENRARSRSKKR